MAPQKAPGTESLMRKSHSSSQENREPDRSVLSGSKDSFLIGPIPACAARNLRNSRPEHRIRNPVSPTLHPFGKRKHPQE